MGFWDSVVNMWNSSSGAYQLYIVVIALFIPLTIVGVVASFKVNSTFAKYSHVSAQCGLTAAEIVRKMLDDNGLNNVNIVRGRGHLTDHFDPRSNIISLSESVYGSTSVAAIGVACHEAGHAIQHAKKFVFARVRMALVPVVNFANNAIFPILMLGFIFGFANPYSPMGNVFVWLAVIVFGVSMIFSLVTLPTEFDASRRAQSALKTSYFNSVEAAGSRKVLTAAAMTYVVSFLMSLIQFLRFFAMLLMSRNNRN